MSDNNGPRADHWLKAVAFGPRSKRGKLGDININRVYWLHILHDTRLASPARPETGPEDSGWSSMPALPESTSCLHSRMRLPVLSHVQYRAIEWEALDAVKVNAIVQSEEDDN